MQKENVVFLSSNVGRAGFLKKASILLKKGGIIIFPTPTVYAYLVDATNTAAVERLYAIKRRPKYNPLMILVNGKEMAADIFMFNNEAHNISGNLWPGPLTLSLPARAKTNLSSYCINNHLGNVACCYHNDNTLSELIRNTGAPLACSSLNLSGYIPITDSKFIDENLSAQVDMVFNNGLVKTGIESTILVFSNNRFYHLRHGAIPLNDISKYIEGKIHSITDNDELAVLISKKKIITSDSIPHYNAGVELRLNASDAKRDEIFLGFGKSEKFDFSLSRDSNLPEAARYLYYYLIKIVSEGGKKVAVSPIPNQGIGITINNRLANARKYFNVTHGEQ